MDEPVVIRIEVLDCDDPELQALGAVTHVLQRSWGGTAAQLTPEAKRRIVTYLHQRYAEGAA
jgi:hypothetical protein